MKAARAALGLLGLAAAFGLGRAALPMAVGVLAYADPARAAAWYEAHRGDAYSAGSLAPIARGWARRRDPAPLFAWLESLGDLGDRDPERRDAVAVGFRRWLGNDRQAAAAWIRTQSPRPALDPALAAFASEMAATDPTDAFEWSERIGDESLRRRTRIGVARTWLRLDPAAAHAWLATSDLAGESDQREPWDGERGDGL